MNLKKYVAFTVSISVLKNKALKANKNYSTVEGVISTTLYDTGEKALAELSIEQPGRFYVKHTSDSKNQRIFEEAVNDGAKIQVKDNKGKINDFVAPAKKKSQELQDVNNDISPDYNGTYLTKLELF